MEKLSNSELITISAGGPIEDAFAWYFDTMGSYYHGLYDGLVGNEPCL
jgi:hypothetical protein